jgi:hypothetical protein
LAFKDNYLHDVGWVKIISTISTQNIRVATKYSSSGIEANKFDM